MRVYTYTHVTLFGEILRPLTEAPIEALHFFASGKAAWRSNMSIDVAEQSAIEQAQIILSLKQRGLLP